MRFLFKIREAYRFSEILSVRFLPNLSLTQSGLARFKQTGLNQHANPKICILDTGTEEPEIDIDGDSLPDLSHAEVIKRILEAYLPKAKITVKNPNEFVYTQKTDILTLVQRALQWCLDEGFDYINLSNGPAYHYSRVQVLHKKMTPENLLKLKPRFRQENLEGVFSKYPDTSKIIALLDELVKAGTRLFVSASNDAGTFNLLHMAEGTDNIGGMTMAYKPVVGFSDNTLLNNYSKAVFNVYKLKRGYDITGDGKVDVLNKEVSGQGKAKVMPEKYCGKSSKTTLATANDITLISQAQEEQARHEIDLLAQKLFTFDQLRELGLVAEDKRDFYTQFGPYMAYQNYQVIAGFDVNNKGKIIYDPERSGKNAVHMFMGNSFATPVALAQVAGATLQNKNSN